MYLLKVSENSRKVEISKFALLNVQAGYLMVKWSKVNESERNSLDKNRVNLKLLLFSHACSLLYIRTVNISFFHVLVHVFPS